MPRLVQWPASLSGLGPARGVTAQTGGGERFIRSAPGRESSDGLPPLDSVRKGGPSAKAQVADGKSQPRTVDEAGRPAPEEREQATGQPAAQGLAQKANGEQLSKAEMALLQELQKADQAVRAHEMAHLAAAGGYAKGGAAFTYQRGPDGQNYAVGGEVQVDTGKEATPEATIQKMQVVRQAALAPVDPSPQDQRVAAQATLQIAESFKELRLLQSVHSQPLTAKEPTVDKEDAARGGTPEMGRGPSLGVTADGGGKTKKSYAAYLRPVTPSARSDRQGLDRFV